MRHCAFLLLACALPFAARAEKLRVDVLIFLNPPSSEETGTAPRHPDDAQAISLDDVRGLAYAGIALLPEDSSTLAAEWNLLKAANRYRPLLRLSWLQEEPRFEGGPALRIYQPGGDGISGLDGWLRLHRGKGALLSADLETVLPGAQGQAIGYRLKERRALTRDTLHYLDSTRIGVLARVSAAR